MSLLYHRGVTRLVTVPDYYSFFLEVLGALFSCVLASACRLISIPWICPRVVSCWRCVLLSPSVYCSSWYFFYSPNFEPFSITEPVRCSVYCLKLFGLSDKLLLTDPVSYPKLIELHYLPPSSNKPNTTGRLIPATINTSQNHTGAITHYPTLL